MWTLEETGETEEIEQLSQLSMQESITGMLLYHVGFSGIWYGWNKILSLYSLVWKETPAALATRKFIWVVTISRIPNKQAKNPASHAQILASPASRGAVKSRIPSRYLSFSRFPATYFGQIPDPEKTLPDPCLIACSSCSVWLQVEYNIMTPSPLLQAWMIALLLLEDRWPKNSLNPLTT